MDFNFKKKTTTYVNSLRQLYDYDSIMHYGAYAFSSNRRPTIVAKSYRSKLGQRSGLSKSDKIQAKLLYCPEGVTGNN